MIIRGGIIAKYRQRQQHSNSLILRNIAWIISTVFRQYRCQFIRYVVAPSKYLYRYVIAVEEYVRNRLPAMQVWDGVLCVVRKSCIMWSALRMKKIILFTAFHILTRKNVLSDQN